MSGGSKTPVLEIRQRGFGLTENSNSDVIVAQRQTLQSTAGLSPAPASPLHSGVTATLIQSLETFTANRIVVAVREMISSGASLTSTLGEGVAVEFDRTIQAAAAICQHNGQTFLESLIAWREQQLALIIAGSDDIANELVQLHVAVAKSTMKESTQIIRDRRLLALDYSFARILAVLLTKPDCVTDLLAKDIEDIAMKFIISADAFKVGGGDVLDMYAKALGVLSASRFNSVRRQFLRVLREQSNPIVQMNIVRSMSRLHLSLFPIQALEESFEFLQDLAKVFVDLKKGDSDLRTAFAGLFVEILVPLVGSANSEVNVPAVRNFVEFFFKNAFDALKKIKHNQMYFPLVTTLLCLSQKAFFLENWSSFVALCLQNLKHKDVMMQRVAFDSLHRLLWVYSVRLKGESSAATLKSIRNITDVIFAKHSRGLVPKDVEPTLFVDMLIFIAAEKPDFIIREIVLELFNMKTVARTIPNPDRALVGLRAFLGIVNARLSKQTAPFPGSSHSRQSSISAPVATTSAVPTPASALTTTKPPQPKVVNVTHQQTRTVAPAHTAVFATQVVGLLSDDDVRDLGMGPYHAAFLASFSNLLHSLIITMLSRNSLMTHSSLRPKAGDTASGSERSQLIALLQASLDCMPRIIPKKEFTVLEIFYLLTCSSIHLDADVRASAYAAMKRFIVAHPNLRSMLIRLLAAFILREVPLSDRLVVEGMLRMLIQLLNAWREAEEAERHSDTLKSRAKQAVIPPQERWKDSGRGRKPKVANTFLAQAAASLMANKKDRPLGAPELTVVDEWEAGDGIDWDETAHSVEALTIVMLCSSRPITRRLSLYIMRSMRLLEKQLNVSTLGVSVDQPNELMIPKIAHLRTGSGVFSAALLDSGSVSKSGATSSRPTSPTAPPSTSSSFVASQTGEPRVLDCIEANCYETLTILRNPVNVNLMSPDVSSMDTRKMINESSHLRFPSTASYLSRPSDSPSTFGRDPLSVMQSTWSVSVSQLLQAPKLHASMTSASLLKNRLANRDDEMSPPIDETKPRRDSFGSSLSHETPNNFFRTSQQHTHNEYDSMFVNLSSLFSHVSSGCPHATKRSWMEVCSRLSAMNPLNSDSSSTLDQAMSQFGATDAIAGVRSLPHFAKTYAYLRADSKLDNSSNKRKSTAGGTPSANSPEIVNEWFNYLLFACVAAHVTTDPSLASSTRRQLNAQNSTALAVPAAVNGLDGSHTAASSASNSPFPTKRQSISSLNNGSADPNVITTSRRLFRHLFPFLKAEKESVQKAVLTSLSLVSRSAISCLVAEIVAHLQELNAEKQGKRVRRELMQLQFARIVNELSCTMLSESLDETAQLELCSRMCDYAREMVGVFQHLPNAPNIDADSDEMRSHFCVFVENLVTAFGPEGIIHPSTALTSELLVNLHQIISLWCPPLNGATLTDSSSNRPSTLFATGWILLRTRSYSKRPDWHQYAAALTLDTTAQRLPLGMVASSALGALLQVPLSSIALPPQSWLEWLISNNCLLGIQTLISWLRLGSVPNLTTSIARRCRDDTLPSNVRAGMFIALYVCKIHLPTESSILQTDALELLVTAILFRAFSDCFCRLLSSRLLHTLPTQLDKNLSATAADPIAPDMNAFLLDTIKSEVLEQSSLEQCRESKRLALCLPTQTVNVIQVLTETYLQASTKAMRSQVLTCMEPWLESSKELDAGNLELLLDLLLSMSIHEHVVDLDQGSKSLVTQPWLILARVHSLHSIIKHLLCSAEAGLPIVIVRKVFVVLTTPDCHPQIVSTLFQLAPLPYNITRDTASVKHPLSSSKSDMNRDAARPSSFRDSLPDDQLRQFSTTLLATLGTMPNKVLRLMNVNGAPVTRGDIAIVLLRDAVTVADTSMLVDFVAPVLHRCILNMDHAVDELVESSLQLFAKVLELLVLSTWHRPASTTSIAAAHHCLSILFQSSELRPWQHQDITPKQPLAKSADLIADLVDNACLALEPYGCRQLWLKEAHRVSVVCSDRHYAARSLEIMRGTREGLTELELGDLLARMAASIADSSDDARGYAMEILLTLDKLSDKIPHPQLFWAAVAVMESDHEMEFMLAMQLLIRILMNLNADGWEKVYRLATELKWNLPSFVGIQNLALKGLTSSFSHNVTFALLTKLTEHCHEPIIDYLREDGFLFNLVALLPYLADTYFSPTEECVNAAQRLITGCKLRQINNVAKLLIVYEQCTYARTEEEWLDQICRFLGELYFGKHGASLYGFLCELLEHGLEKHQKFALVMIGAFLKYCGAAGFNERHSRSVCALMQGNCHEQVIKILHLIMTSKMSAAGASEPSSNSNSVADFSKLSWQSLPQAQTRTRERLSQVMLTCGHKFSEELPVPMFRPTIHVVGTHPGFGTVPLKPMSSINSEWEGEEINESEFFTDFDFLKEALTDVVAEGDEKHSSLSPKSPPRDSGVPALDSLETPKTATPQLSHTTAQHQQSAEEMGSPVFYRSQSRRHTAPFVSGLSLPAVDRQERLDARSRIAESSLANASPAGSETVSELGGLHSYSRGRISVKTSSESFVSVHSNRDRSSSSSPVPHDEPRLSASLSNSSTSLHQTSGKSLMSPPTLHESREETLTPFVERADVNQSPIYHQSSDAPARQFISVVTHLVATKDLADMATAFPTYALAFKYLKSECIQAANACGDSTIGSIISALNVPYVTIGSNVIGKSALNMIGSLELAMGQVHSALGNLEAVARESSRFAEPRFLQANCARGVWSVLLATEAFAELAAKVVSFCPEDFSHEIRNANGKGDDSKGCHGELRAALLSLSTVVKATKEQSRAVFDQLFMTA